jgi:hypothetical protein
VDELLRDVIQQAIAGAQAIDEAMPGVEKAIAGLDLAEHAAACADVRDRWLASRTAIYLTLGAAAGAAGLGAPAAPRQHFRPDRKRKGAPI